MAGCGLRRRQHSAAGVTWLVSKPLAWRCACISSAATRHARSAARDAYMQVGALCAAVPVQNNEGQLTRTLTGCYRLWVSCMCSADTAVWPVGILHPRHGACRQPARLLLGWAMTVAQHACTAQRPLTCRRPNARQPHVSVQAFVLGGVGLGKHRAHLASLPARASQLLGMSLDARAVEDAWWRLDGMCCCARGHLSA